ncbi:unnamed protein product [Arctogadus glacialis]
MKGMTADFKENFNPLQTARRARPGMLHALLIPGSHRLQPALLHFEVYCLLLLSDSRGLTLLQGPTCEIPGSKFKKAQDENTVATAGAVMWARDEHTKCDVTTRRAEQAGEKAKSSFSLFQPAAAKRSHSRAHWSGLSAGVTRGPPPTSRRAEATSPLTCVWCSAVETEKLFGQQRTEAEDGNNGICSMTETMHWCFIVPSVDTRVCVGGFGQYFLNNNEINYA